ncbi:hypothetical protein HYE82_11185 [Streptomyces sp. BR123]|uniref:hypothetical protein n=1 Tax=Streptomyces sp. BR123 TaxID=2749828 RepID=UPI0015C4CE09|nr:hypothetical protein [Streptomyces sp. BR123]NXY94947.1 hypothetical protein [Streptomyces sp. BR123]
MEPRIVYVHGDGNKPREEVLTSQWDSALFGVDMGSASRMAHWAPLLHPEPLPDGRADPLDGGAVPAEETRESAPASVEATEEFVARTLAEARAETAGRAAGAEGAPGTGAGSDQPLAGWLRDMGYLAEALAQDGGPPVGAPGGPEARLLPSFARTRLFRLLVEHTFKDVHAYFFGGAGAAIRDVVRQALDQAREGAGAGGPLVVVGHSLGSIVAYEVLAEEPRDVDLFVTIGSPLAITEIQDVLAGPPAVPAGVAVWRNASDLRDLVALDHTLRPEYAPVHLVTDHLVLNTSGNHHGAREYLATGPVREPVRALFGGLAARQTG